MSLPQGPVSTSSDGSDHPSTEGTPHLTPLLVSACLVGLDTRLDGKSRHFPAVLSLASRYLLVPVCPEQLGGGATPRPAAEIVGAGGGAAVLDGAARVKTEGSEDVTDCFLRGATQVLRVARLVGARSAVLKARSPSCGVGFTYDGTFTHTVCAGSGVTAAILQREGLTLCTEEDCHLLLEEGWEAAGERGHRPQDAPAGAILRPQSRT